MSKKSMQKQGDDFQPLRELLPLRTPLAMSIDTSEVCNFRCQFCIYNQSREKNLLGERNKARPFMEMEVFRKLVADLGEFPEKVRKISVHCRGEPLLHPQIADMIRLMKDANVADCIKMATNGSLMTRDKAKAILDAGLGQLVFSVEHVTNEGYFAITGGAWNDYGKIVDNFRMVREERDKGGYDINLCAKILDFLNEDELDTFRKDFGGIADTLLITGLYGGSKQGEVDGTLGKGQSEGFYKSGLKTDRNVCPQPFFFLTVDARGKIMPCWVDWSNEAVIGDIREDSLLNIWNGAQLREFRLCQLEGRRKEQASCENCHFVYGVHPQSDIDDKAEYFAEIYRSG